MQKAVSLSSQVQIELEKPTLVRRFVVSRINLNPLFLTDQEREFLVKQINEKSKVIHIGEHTIFANSITSISPRYSKEEMQVEVKKLEKINKLNESFRK